jgi:hypothetical protein
MLAAAVTALVLSACGGPLEEEQAQLEAQQQELNMVVVDSSGQQVQQLPALRDGALRAPIQRPEQRFYGVGTPK